MQHKLVSGSNTLDAVLTPTPSADGMSFADFHYDAQGTLQPEASNVWQFNFELVKALNVGPSGTHADAHASQLEPISSPCPVFGLQKEHPALSLSC